MQRYHKDRSFNDDTNLEAWEDRPREQPNLIDVGGADVAIGIVVWVQTGRYEQMIRIIYRRYVGKSPVGDHELIAFGTQGRPEHVWAEDIALGPAACPNGQRRHN